MSPAAPDPGPSRYAFGPFELDPRERLLRRDGVPVVLAPRLFETLRVLVENAGHLLERRELLERLWPDAVVDEANLSRNIWLLRRALGEGDDERSYIETVPRVGYRFVAPVERVPAALPEWAPAPPAQPPAGEREPATAAELAAEPMGDIAPALPVPAAPVPRASRRIAVGGWIAALVGLATAVVTARFGKPPIVRPETALRAGAPSSAPPVNAAAARLYAEGLERLRAYDPVAAREPLERAVAADPQSALAHCALAQAWSAQGDASRARDEAAKAFHLADSLASPERLAIEARYRAVLGEWDRAIELGRSLTALAPDDLEAGLALAAAETAGGQPQAALITLERLRTLPAPAHDDPRLALQEAMAAERAGDYHREEAVASRALAQAAARKAPLLEAAARRAVGWARYSVGQTQAALTELARARDLCATSGDLGCVARMQNNLAAIYHFTGELDRARDLYRLTIENRRAAGDRSGTARAECNLATLLEEQGDLATARATFERSLTTFLEIGDRGAAASTQTHLGSILHRQGHLTAAGRMYEEAVARHRTTGDRRELVFALADLGDTWAQRGRPKAAEAPIAEAMTLARSLDLKQNEPYIRCLEGDLRGMGGDPAGALAEYRAALSLARRMHSPSAEARALHHMVTALLDVGDLVGARRAWRQQAATLPALGRHGDTAASTGLLEAELALAENRPAAAAAAARRMIGIFHGEARLDDEVEARIALARALRLEGRLEPARSALSGAAFGERSERLWLRLELALETARIAGTTSGPAAGQAATTLAAIERQAAAAGLVGIQLEARLALGEVEIVAGRAAQGRARLTELARETEARGYGLLARQARAAGR